MTSTSAKHRKIATPRCWEVATLGDLLDASAACGVQAGLLYRAIDHLADLSAERVSDSRQLP